MVEGKFAVFLGFVAFLFLLGLLRNCFVSNSATISMIQPFIF